MNVIAGLDSRPDLLALKPVEFDHLIRDLAVDLPCGPCSRSASVSRCSLVSGGAASTSRAM
jgi:hypothetical protein